MPPNDTTGPPPERATTTRDNWLFAAVGAAMLCLVGTVFALGLVMRYADEDGTAAAAGSAVVVDVELGDLYVRPSSIEVPAGSPVTLRVSNAGAMPHDLKVDGTEGTEMLDPGGRAEVPVGSFERSTQAWCTVPGHKEAGMVLDIVVTGAASDAHGSGEAAAVAASPTGGGDAEIDVAAEPADGWRPFDPALQPAPGGTEHQVTMRATETVLEVAPGVTQEMWTFDDQVPGPTLRGKVGDLFTITLVNEGKLGHSIDLHASKVAWNDEMRTIQPGESLVYQFEAKFAGVFMYHCGTAPALHHIGNGMFGAIIVDPPELAPVDHEVMLVQSELYTGPEGGPAISPR